MSEYPGMYIRNRAAQIFCNLLANNQVVVVTDAADVLALVQPDSFTEKYVGVQVRPPCYVRLLADVMLYEFGTLKSSLAAFLARTRT